MQGRTRPRGWECGQAAEGQAAAETGLRVDGVVRLVGGTEDPFKRATATALYSSRPRACDTPCLVSTCALVSMCTHARTIARTHAHMHACMHANTRAHIRVCISVCVCARICACVPPHVRERVSHGSRLPHAQTTNTHHRDFRPASQSGFVFGNTCVGNTCTVKAARNATHKI